MTRSLQDVLIGLVADLLTSASKLVPIETHLPLLESVLSDSIDATGLSPAITNLNTSIDELRTTLELDAESDEILMAITYAVEGLQQLHDEVTSFLEQTGLESEVVEDLSRRLLKILWDYIVYNYLLKYQPKVFSILHLISVTELSPTAAGIDIPSIKYQNISRLFSEPGSLLNDIYNWDSGLNTPKLFARLSKVLQVLGLPGGMYRQVGTLRDNLQQPPWMENEIRIPLFAYVNEGNRVQISLNLCPLSPTDDHPTGLYLYPFINGSFSLEQALSENWSLEIKGTMTLDGEFGISILPPTDIEVQQGLLNPSGLSVPGTAHLEISLAREEVDDSLTMIFGKPEETSLGFQKFRLKLILGQHDGKYSATIESLLEDLTLRVKPGEDSDGFLNKVLAGVDLKSVSDLGIGLSSQEGFYFTGSASLEVTIPLNIELGPLLIENLLVGVGFNESDFDLKLASSFGVKLGPIAASVTRMGIKIPFSFPENKDGNLGPVNVRSPVFIPPLGAGLSLNLSTLAGGGYLEFDNENKRYAGIIYLRFEDLGLTAIALITTRMPDGSDGFSMLVVIGVEFDPPITLPYNFTLSGVGGLLGIQRSMNVDYLREGLKQGTLDSVLFPVEPIKNANRIISDLRAGFPPDEGRYILGPMAIINWGNPKIISAEVGIFIEVPSPVRIAILGQITAILPDSGEDTEPVAVIHMDILGVLDIAKKCFALDAVIYDSRILAYTLSGDMAMRLFWGDSPYFLMSLGGYNPKFNARPGTPVLRRMTLAMGSGDNPRIALECYMALTSNTTQFGAKLELNARKSGFKVHGYLYFDALFIFSPFSFIVDMGAGVEVFKGSRCLLTVNLDFTLSGPTPWRARGVAKFEVLFVDVKVRFDKTWGRREAVSLPARNPCDDLLLALENPGNWQGLLPSGREQLVHLREFDETDEAVIVHPSGRLKIIQKVVPLNLDLEKYGNGPLAGSVSNFTLHHILPVEGGESQELPSEYVVDHFAMAQFQNLSDAEKLSRPSFEKADAGIIIGSDDLELSQDHVRSIDLSYETEVIDEDRITEKLHEPTGLPWVLGRAMLVGRAGMVSNATRFTGTDEPLVSMQEESFMLVSRDNLEGIGETDGIYAQIRTEMQRNNLEYPQHTASTQIVSSYEVPA